MPRKSPVQKANRLGTPEYVLFYSISLSCQCNCMVGWHFSGVYMPYGTSSTYLIFRNANDSCNHSLWVLPILSAHEYRLRGFGANGCDHATSLGDARAPQQISGHMLGSPCALSGQSCAAFACLLKPNTANVSYGLFQH